MTRPRRILHILNELRFSGAETMLASAGAVFAAEGWESHVLSTGDRAGAFAPVLEQAGYRLHHIPFAKSLAFCAAVQGLVAKGGFDLVHIHSERAFPLYAALAAPSAGVVRTVHSVFPFTGGLRLRKILERWACRRLLGVRFMSPSPSVARNEQSRFFLKTSLCRNWYDDRRFVVPLDAERAMAREALGYGPHDLVAASIGAYSSLKNQDAILGALALLPPESRPFYLHAGQDRDPATGRSLAQKARELGVERWLRCVGEGDVLPCLRAADMFLMPSEREGVGIAAIEAMAAGVPAILSSRPGLEDFAAIAPAIRYCEPAAPDLARQIAALAGLEPSERRRIGAELASAMRHAYRIEAGVRGYLDLYEQVAG